MKCSRLAELVLQRIRDVGGYSQHDSGEEVADEGIRGNAFAQGGLHPFPAGCGDARQRETCCGRGDFEIPRRGGDEFAGDDSKLHDTLRVELAGISRRGNWTKAADDAHRVFEGGRARGNHGQNVAGEFDFFSIDFDVRCLHDEAGFSSRTHRGFGANDSLDAGHLRQAAEFFSESCRRGLAGLHDLQSGEQKRDSGINTGAAAEG